MTPSKPSGRYGAAAVLTLAVGIPAQSAMDVAVHVMNRVGFGPTPFEITPLLAGTPAVTSYIQSQLAPGPVTNFVANALLAQVQYPANQGAPFTIESLQLDSLIRAAYSEWQLQEVMTRFWSDHFNRSHDKNRFVFGNLQPGITNGADFSAWHMWQDETFYRTNAFGTFENLLRYTAGSVSMLLYLDNHDNVLGQNNENWARELLELYTMGEVNRSLPSPNNRNYDQSDIVGVARCFTGWRVQIGAGPTFTSSYGTLAQHDSGLKSLFQPFAHPLTVNPGGTAQVDGDLLITHLANTNATKDFIVRKLMVQFLGDDAPTAFPALLNQTKLQWGSGGNITAMLQTLLLSPEFLNCTTQWGKIKSPLHFNTSLLRTLYAVPDAAPPTLLFDALHLWVHGLSMFGMGQTPFMYPSPDGYPMSSARQIGVSGFVDRIDSAQRTHQEVGDYWYPASAFDVTFYPSIWVINDLTPTQLANTGSIADYLLVRYFGDKPIPTSDRNLVIGKLTAYPSPTFDNDVREACELITSLNAFKVH